MTFSRLLSLDTRSGYLVAVGTAILFVPPLAGMTAAAIATGIILGICIVGLGLAGTASNGRGTLPLSAHAAYDQGLAFGLLLCGGAFAAVGDTAAMALFGATGLVTLLITGATRYTAPGGAQDFL